MPRNHYNMSETRYGAFYLFLKFNYLGCSPIIVIMDQCGPQDNVCILVDMAEEWSDSSVFPDLLYTIFRKKNSKFSRNRADI